MADVSGTVFSADEQVIGSLGEGYLSSILSGRGVGRSSMLLTNKRLYISCKQYGVRRGNSRIDMDFNTCDLSGSAFYQNSRILARIVLFLLLMGVCVLFITLAEEAYDTEETLYYLVAAVFGMCGIIIPLLMRPIFILGIIASGHEYAIPLHKYSLADIVEFRKRLSLEIENARAFAKGV